MHPLHAGRRLAGRLNLTGQVALLTLVPIIALGFILARVLEHAMVSRTVDDASRSAQLIARIGIQPQLTPRDLQRGLDPTRVRELDHQLSARSAVRDLARIKIWNAHDRVIYSDDHRLIGKKLPPSEELENALEGRPEDAAVVNPKPNSETADEVGLGRLVEVYVPLRFAGSARPAGTFEIYLSYKPIATALGRDKRTITLVVSIALALLWALLFRIVARASRRLRRQSEENYRLAHYDSLTGLPNRRLFRERATAALERDDAHHERPAVLLIDLDGFREINNTLGPATGDHVLCEVARRLADALGGDALVARLGGDEYAVLYPCPEGVPGALAAAGVVQKSMEAPILLDSVALNVESSIGIAVMGEHARELHTLLRGADAALERAKSMRSRIEISSPAADIFDPQRLLLLGEVRTALERQEFELHYQPKIDLRSEAVTGVEALLRWRHPERGLLAPMSFIPLVEQTSLISPLASWVISQALAQMVVWREQGLQLEMSVNLSARNLLDPDLTGQVAGLLRQHGVPPADLTVEVTESATLADPDRAAEVLRGLRGAGVRVSIDDFGTGNASIAYLTRLPASEIKIDKSFITPICLDARAQAIVSSTVDLARHLELHVVAEGVESRETLERVRDLGCDTGQGYLISPPLPAAEMTALLRSAVGLPGRGRGGVSTPRDTRLGAQRRVGRRAATGARASS